MPAAVHDDVLDAALQEIVDNADLLVLCNAEPTTYNEANATFRIGSKATPAIGSPENGLVNGRRITVAAITDGTGEATDDATWWAILDTDGSRIMAKNTLASALAVTNAVDWALPAFDIAIPDAVSA